MIMKLLSEGDFVAMAEPVNQTNKFNGLIISLFVKSRYLKILLFKTEHLK